MKSLVSEDIKRKKLGIIICCVLFFLGIVMVIPVTGHLFLTITEKLLHRRINLGSALLSRIQFLGISTCIFSIIFCCLYSTAIIDIMNKDKVIILFWVFLLIQFIISNVYLVFNKEMTGNGFDFGDFFYSVWTCNRASLNLYPPLAELYYRTLRLLVPSSILNVEDYQLLRQSFEGCYLLIINGLVSVIPFILFTHQALKKKDEFKVFFVLALCFSGPFIFSIFRSNILLIAFNFAILFYGTYDSEKKWVKELGLISLGISFALKLYPAVLGVVLLKDKRWKDAVRCALYGLLLLFLPMLFFEKGFLEIINLLKGAESFTESGFNYLTGTLSLKSNLYFIFSRISSSRSLFSLFYYVVLFVYFVISIFIILSAQRKWHVWYVLASACYIVPGLSWPYVAIFLVIPLIEIINDSEYVKFDFFVLIIFFLIFCYDRAFSFALICPLLTLVLYIGIFITNLRSIGRRSN